MISAVTVLLYVLPLLGALWAFVKLVANKALNPGTRADRLLLGFVGLIEAVVIVQAIAGFILMFTDGRDIHRLTFSAYLLGLLFLMPVGTWWALGDRTRGGTGVLIVACLALPAMVLRLSRIWVGHA